MRIPGLNVDAPEVVQGGRVVRDPKPSTLILGSFDETYQDRPRWAEAGIEPVAPGHSQAMCLFIWLSGVYTSNLFSDSEFYLGQLLSVYEAKSLGKYLAQIFSFINGPYTRQYKRPKFELLSGNSRNHV